MKSIFFVLHAVMSKPSDDDFQLFVQEVEYHAGFYKLSSCLRTVACFVMLVHPKFLQICIFFYTVEITLGIL